MRKIFKSILFLLTFFLLFSNGTVSAADKLTLCQRLVVEKGVDPALVMRYCSGKESGFHVDTKIIGKNLKQVEYKATYDRFLSPASVRKAQAFLDKNRDWLQDVERKFKVEAEIITAIFLVESDFGHYPGRYSLLQVFSSLASCDQDKYLQDVFKELKVNYPDLDYKWLKKRARKKAAWGYAQLVALLQLADRLEVETVKGSWAGAFGVCQFIPSSCLSYAVDGSGDGRIDLYDFKDAAASVANYLKAHGWQSGFTVKQQEKVVWSYNHSQLYCQTVVALAGRLQ